MNLFQSELYQSAVRVAVVDNAHCISEWRVFQGDVRRE